MVGSLEKPFALGICKWAVGKNDKMSLRVHGILVKLD
jgi:hypothetical protein